MESKAVDILNSHRLMTIATLRPDGWPQATMVSYANEGLLLYFIISRQSQKYANIYRDSRVGITIGRDFDDPAKIRGLSIAANASEVRDPMQRERAVELILERHPALAKLGGPDLQHSAVVRAYSSIVTIIDYSKGFGHTDLVRVTDHDLAEHIEARRHHWAGFQAA